MCELWGYAWPFPTLHCTYTPVPAVPLQALYRAHALSEGGQRHVTIADLSQGVVHPSKVRVLRLLFCVSLTTVVVTVMCVLLVC